MEDTADTARSADELIHVYVGTDKWQRSTFAEIALEESIRDRTSGAVLIHWMRQGDTWNWGGWPWGWATPFSLFRWMVPDFASRNGHGSRAIYMDVDQLALGDLRELWCWDLKGHPAAWHGRPDAILFDVDACMKLYPEGGFPERVDEDGSVWVGEKDDVHAFLSLFRRAVNAKRLRLPPEWNVLDEVTREAKILHFTCMRTQPWKPYRIGVLPEDPDRVLDYEPHPHQSSVMVWEYFRHCAKKRHGVDDEMERPKDLILPPEVVN